MKIVLFIHSLRDGGAERVCSYIANYWADAGLEVTLVTVALPSKDDYMVSSKVKRISLGLDKKSSNAVDAIVGNYQLVSKLRKTLLSNDVDVALSFMARSNVICALACLGTRKFHIAAERNFSAMDDHGLLWNTLRKLTYRFADVVVAQTEKGCNWIENHTNAKRVETIPNPIVYPLDRSKCSDDIPVDPDTCFVLAVGRLSPQKQFHHLIDAFAHLPEKMNHWQLYILGEGKERSGLEARIHQKELSDRVKLIGRVDKISQWYERAEIFALSSKYEGFPNALAEAMSYGVSVVSYDCETGPSELIENGKSGFLVTPNSVTELSTKIEELAGSETLRASFGRNAENVRKTYALNVVMKQWTELLP